MIIDIVVWGVSLFFFFQAEDGIRDYKVTGVQTCALPIYKFVYDGVPGTHQWYDGSQRPWEFKRVWHLEPSLKDPDTVYAGVEDAALFRSTDGAQNWKEVSGLRGHGSGPRWQPGGGGLCLHTIIEDPKNPKRIFV